MVKSKIAHMANFSPQNNAVAVRGYGAAGASFAASGHNATTVVTAEAGLSDIENV